MAPPDEGDDPFNLDFTKIAAKAKPAAPPPPSTPAKPAAPTAKPALEFEIPQSTAAPAKPAAKAPAAPPPPAAKSAAPAAKPALEFEIPQSTAKPAAPKSPPAAKAPAPPPPKPAAPAAKAPAAPAAKAAPPPAPPAAKPAAPPPAAAAPAAAPAAAEAPKPPLSKLRQKLAARQAAAQENAPTAEKPAPAKPVAPAAKPAAPEARPAAAKAAPQATPPAAKPAPATTTPVMDFGLEPLDAPPAKIALDFVAPAPEAPPPMPKVSTFGAPAPAAEFSLDSSAPLLLADEPEQPRPKTPGEQLLDEVALLHAAGSSSDALSKLETALRAGTLGDSTEQGWGMLFDLLQVLNRRQAFETLADAYAKRFEKSAPAWLDTDDITEDAETAAAQVALSGTLSAASESALKKLVEISQKNPTVHLNLVKVTDADNDGCRLLLETLRVFKKNKRECLIVGADEFAALLANKIEMMQREREETWLLVLELSQQQGKQEFFEDIAVGYAVTFEVSPPSWETVKPGKKAAAAPAKVVKDPMVLEGELLIGMGAIAALATAAKGKDAITIESDRLQRIDAASAHALLSELTPLASHGMHIRIRGLSMLIYTLFHIVGIDQIASIEIRRR